MTIFIWILRDFYASACFMNLSHSSRWNLEQKQQPAALWWKVCEFLKQESWFLQTPDMQYERCLKPQCAPKKHKHKKTNGMNDRTALPVPLFTGHRGQVHLCEGAGDRLCRRHRLLRQYRERDKHPEEGKAPIPGPAELDDSLVLGDCESNRTEQGWLKRVVKEERVGVCACGGGASGGL